MSKGLIFDEGSVKGVMRAFSGGPGLKDGAWVIIGKKCLP